MKAKGRRNSAISNPRKLKQPDYLKYATPQGKPKTVFDLIRDISGTGLEEENVMSPNEQMRKNRAAAAAAAQAKKEE